MKRALLYCPMNPPRADAPPSGDRTMASLISAALGLAGYTVMPASSLRSYEGTGDAAWQKRIAALAVIERERLIDALLSDRPALWATYLNYYKSPDYLGPLVCKALKIPYLIAEASHAAKRRTGAFAAPYAAARSALEMADAVCCMTEQDWPGLAQIVPPGRLHRLEPFLDMDRFTGVASVPRSPTVILTIAMLRPGKKLENFRLIADALARLLDLDWTYVIAGDGEGRAAAAAMLGGLPPERIRWLGRVEAEDMPAVYAASGLYFWPGLREAYGMAYLEAQAAGLPVVACDTHGVPAVVEHGRTGLLTRADDPTALAMSLRRLLTDPICRAAMSDAAAAFVRRKRTIGHAAERLRAILDGIGA